MSASRHGIDECMRTVFRWMYMGLYKSISSAFAVWVFCFGWRSCKKNWNSREKPMSNYIYQKHRFHHWPLAVTFIMTCILLQYIGRVSIIAVSQTELSVSFLHSDSDRQHFHFYASPLQIFSQRYTWIENGAIEGGMDRIRADYRHPGSLGLWLLQTLDGKQEPNLRQSRCLIYRNVAVCVQ